MLFLVAVVVRVLGLCGQAAGADDGSRMWLGFAASSVAGPELPAGIDLSSLSVTPATAALLNRRSSDSPEAAIVNTTVAELVAGLGTMLGRPVPVTSAPKPGGVVLRLEQQQHSVHWQQTEGYTITVVPLALVDAATATATATTVRAVPMVLRVSAGGGAGLMHGGFELMALLQRRQAVVALAGGGVVGEPRMQLRHWDLWDNLDGNIERGFGGNSVIWPIHARADTTTDTTTAGNDAITEIEIDSAGLECLLPGTQTYNAKNGDSVLCFSEACRAANHDPIRIEGYAMPASPQPPLTPPTPPTVPLLDCFDASRHDNWMSTNNGSCPAGYSRVGGVQAYALAAGGGADRTASSGGDGDADADNNETAVLETFVHAARGQHVTVATDEGRAWAAAHGYSSLAVLGRIYTAQRPGCAPPSPSPPHPSPPQPSPPSPHPPGPPTPPPPSYEARVVGLARLMASVGLNGLVLNNVNACGNNAKIIASNTLADIASQVYPTFTRYGITLYASVCFASPILLGKLKTADPLDREVAAFWANKTAEIYTAMPLWGGFLVKADAEGQPGPASYGRTEAQGANVLAKALAPHAGIVVWRAFVYGHSTKDRAVQAYDTFKPLDGHFGSNVVVQVKNGPMDFQVREPLSSILGMLPSTNVMMEVQAAQEYTGQQIHVCGLVKQWESYLAFDTMAGDARNATVAKLLTGQVYNYSLSGIAAVSNIGNNANWTGHILAGANFYGFARLAWDPWQSSETIHRDWAAQTFSPDNSSMLDVVVEILETSWLIYEQYNSPLGLGFLCEGGYGGGPCDGKVATTAPAATSAAPWSDRPGASHYRIDPEADVLYTNASSHGVGCNRNSRAGGTNYSGQFSVGVRDMFDNLNSCPEELLLFFHHLPFDYKLKSGLTVIEHIYHTHIAGVGQVQSIVDAWSGLVGAIDPELHAGVAARLAQQLRDAGGWRDTIINYFQKLSGVSPPTAAQLHYHR